MVESVPARGGRTGWALRSFPTQTILGSQDLPGFGCCCSSRLALTLLPMAGDSRGAQRAQMPLSPPDTVTLMLE